MFGWLKNNSAQRKVQEADWFADAIALHPNTPDIISLTRKQFHLIFVYGTEMAGHPQHDLVNHYGAYVATAYTGQKLTLWKKRLGESSFPIALEGAGWMVPDWARPKHAHVQGELYAIETEGLINLDKHYQNTLEFERVRMLMTIPYRKLFRIAGPLSPLQEQIEKQLKIRPDQVVTTQSHVEVVKAWVYIGKPKYWDDQLGHFFKPVNTFKPRTAWLGDYFSFTPSEYAK